MAYDGLNKKAQTSIEFLFLFLIMLIAVNTIIYPKMAQSQRAVMEIHKLGQARLAVKQLANTIGEVAATTGESQQTIWIFLDDNIKIYCDTTDNKITFEIPIQAPAFSVTEGGVVVGNCDGVTCTGSELIHFPDAALIELDCSNFHLCDTALDPSCNYIDGSFTKKAKVLITKQYALGKALIRVHPQEPH
jgi:uncharacterized protein (UPF0333 family)